MIILKILIRRVAFPDTLNVADDRLSIIVLYGDLLDADSNPETVIGMELFKAMENAGVFGDIRSVSAREFIGMEEIYAATQLAFFAGEDNQRE